MKTYEEIQNENAKLMAHNNALIGSLMDAINGLRWWMDEYPEQVSCSGQEKLSEFQRLIDHVTNK